MSPLHCSQGSHLFNSSDKFTKDSFIKEFIAGWRKSLVVVKFRKKAKHIVYETRLEAPNWRYLAP